MDMIYHDFLAGAQDNPYLLSLSIALFTFVLEDASTVAAALFAAEGTISWWGALFTLFCGIFIGDLWLYSMGWLAARFSWAQRLIHPHDNKVGTFLKQRLWVVVFTARFIPGMRLPTYTACGLLGVDVYRFILAVVFAAGLWTSVLFALTYHLGASLMEMLGQLRWIVGPALIAIVVLLPWAVRWLRQPNSAKREEL